MAYEATLGFLSHVSTIQFCPCPFSVLIHIKTTTLWLYAEVKYSEYGYRVIYRVGNGVECDIKLLMFRLFNCCYNVSLYEPTEKQRPHFTGGFSMIPPPILLHLLFESR